MNNCKAPGCKNSVRKNEYCETHYRRIKKYGDPEVNFNPRVPSERLEAAVVAARSGLPLKQQAHLLQIEPYQLNYIRRLLRRDGRLS